MRKTSGEAMVGGLTALEHLLKVTNAFPENLGGNQTSCGYPHFRRNVSKE